MSNRFLLDHGILRPGSTLEPLSALDLDTLRSFGRRDDSFEALAALATRLRLLTAVGCVPSDIDAWVGMRRLEVSALVGLALRSPETTAQGELRRHLFAGALDGRDDNLSVMLAACLTADEARGAGAKPSTEPSWPTRGLA